jgi:hypothetical protein
MLLADLAAGGLSPGRLDMGTEPTGSARLTVDPQVLVYSGSYIATFYLEALLV